MAGPIDFRAAWLRLSTVSFAALVLSATSCATVADSRSARPPAGRHYVAMGSSFAAGSGIGELVEGSPRRCRRSSQNYAHQLARMLDLDLTDVSCGGATTAHVLSPWNELPAQIDALRPDTMLVTVTIGGNDVNYVGGLMAGSCEPPPAEGAVARVCKGLAAHAASDPDARKRAEVARSEDAWQTMEAGLQSIAQAVRSRSPNARLVFVDYLTVLPDQGVCPQAPLSPAAARSARTTAGRLAQVTAQVAQDTGADLIRASNLSKGHDACASTPWINGFIPSGAPERYAPYHPNLIGMTAVAEALGRHLSLRP